MYLSFILVKVKLSKKKQKKNNLLEVIHISVSYFFVFYVCVFVIDYMNSKSKYDFAYKTDSDNFAS